MANDTWDPVTATATLSGGNLVVTSNSSSIQGAHVAGTSGKTSGKYYFEITLTTKIGGGSSGFGIGTPTSTYASMGSNATTGDALYLTGPIYVNGSNTLTLNPTGLTAGRVIGIAVDLDNRTIWFREWANVGGSWNQFTGSGKDPATNVGGLTIPAGTMVPWCMSNSTGNVYTANFGDSGFTGAVPAGFAAGWPGTVAVTANAVRAMVLA